MKQLPLALAAFCALISFSSLSAQSNFSNPGRFNFSAGIGVLPTYLKDSRASNSIPVHLRVGYSVSKSFNLSAYAGYSSASTETRFFNDGVGSHLENKSFLLGMRGEVRRELLKRMDIYGGAAIGYSRANIAEVNSFTGEAMLRGDDEPTPYNPNRKKGQAMYAAFFGTTFYLTKGIGLYAELGYGISLLNTGFTFRI